MSNSKLSSEQKQELRTMRNYLSDFSVFHFPNMRVTVVIRERGESMGDFGVSICSNSELKFRKKVGEYHALSRVWEGKGMPMRITSDEYSTLEDTAFRIACAVSEA